MGMTCHLRHTDGMSTSRPPQQLDIFADSRDVMLRNDVLQALQQHDATAAHRCCLRLAEEFPQDADLPALQRLAAALRSIDTTRLPDHASAAAARQSIEQELLPAAIQTMGEGGARWLLPRWCALAQRSTGLPYVPAFAENHAAALWLRGEDWAAAAQATSGITSWRRIPLPLMWMTHARYRLEGMDPCWPLLAELAWIAPGKLGALLHTLRDPLLTRLRKQFDANFEGRGNTADLAWFPAWVLTATPALAALLSQSQPGPMNAAEQGMRSMLSLLSLERQGRHHELVQGRRALRELHAGLYAAYMLTR
jgi:hypothetical protein